MLGSMTARQLREWQIYYAHEPFSETRMDLRFAQMVAALLNVHRGKGKVVSIKDVLLDFGDEEKEPEPEKSWQELKRIGKSMMALFSEDPAKKRLRRPTPNKRKAR